MTDPDVTAIIPVFNDRCSLEIAIPRSIQALALITEGFELIIAEDGSTDGSADLVRQCEQHGKIVCYYDVDLATDMHYLPELIRSIKEGADIATGSRLMPESEIVRTGGREIASRSYNFLVRLFLGSTIHDHQCGFKAFKKGQVVHLLPEIQSNHWFWDTELLVRAQRKGCRVREFPVLWRAGKGTTVKINDVFEMGSSILRLWWQIHVSEN